MQNLNVPEKIKVFLWRVYENGIKTNHYLNHLKLRDNLCSDCDVQVETTIQAALRDCKVEKQFWIQLVSNASKQVFFQADIKKWLELNMNHNHSRNDVEWSGVWEDECYNIWYWRKCYNIWCCRNQRLHVLASRS